jgi:hypothetical protein
MPDSLIPVFVPIALAVALVVLGRRFSSWTRLSQVYPLADEWPDRSYSGTMVAADPFPYRVTVGASSRGVTFHGFFMRLTGSAVFIPWPELTATPDRSLYFGKAINLTFAGAPDVHVVLPEAVWPSLLSCKPLRPSQGKAGV